MEPSKNALIVSDNIQLTEELKRLLAELNITDVAEANSEQKAIGKLLVLTPAFTFLDLDSENIKTQPLTKILESGEATKLSLIFKQKHKPEWLYEESEKICFIRKPVTLTKLNDIINPHLSFANLLDEARALLRKENGSQE